jgi:hypothetical protein
MTGSDPRPTSRCLCSRDHSVMALVRSTKRSSSISGPDSAQAGDTHKKLRLPPCPVKYKKLQGARFPPTICALSHVLEVINDLLLAPVEAIVMAVKRKEQQWLHYLLERFHWKMSDVLLQSAFSGDGKTVAALLPSMYYPGSGELKDGAWNVLEEAVERASLRGYSAVVRLLLPKVVESGDCGFVAWTVIEAAARNGHLDLVAFAADIADGENGVDARESSSMALLRAISGNHAATATFLVNRYYRDWGLERALEKALERGLSGVVDCIHDALLKEDYITSSREAFVDMAGDSLENALLYLSAAKSAGIGMLTLLLDTGKVSAEAFDAAFWYAARGRRIVIVSFLSRHELASARSIAHAFESAGDSLVSQCLYYKLQDPAEATRTAFRNAAYVGPRYIYSPMLDADRIAVVRFLVSTGHVPAELITEAFMGAATSERIAIVRALCDDPCGSLGIKCGAFRQAAEAGRAQVLTLLAGKVRLPLSTKSEALKIATRRGQLEALLSLCGIEDWSVDVLAEARASAVDSRARMILQGALDHANMASFSDP